MANEKLRKHMRTRWIQQHRLCIWCGLETWIPDNERYALKIERLKIYTSEEFDQRRATAEHLIHKHKYGSDEIENIVSACWKCNNSRGGKNHFVPHPEVVILLPLEMQFKFSESLKL